MLYKSITRTQAEKVFVNVKNGFATTLTTGYVCAYDLKGDSTGVTVSQPETATNSAWYALAGAAKSDIATGGYGLVQTYGVADVYCSTESSNSADVEVGQVVGPISGTFYLTSAGLSDGKSGCAFVAAERIISGSLTTKKVFIRCM